MGSNIISSLNAGSGIDTKSLVEGLVNAEKAPKEQLLTSRQTKLETQISAYGTLKSSLSTFQSALEPLSNSDTFNARSVAFPDSDIITPTELSANAQSGSYQIEVLEIAQSQSLASGAIADADAALGAGELTFRFGSWDSYTADDPVGFTLNADQDALTIELDADDSLNDLVDKINAADSGLQASVIVNDGQSQLLLTTPSGKNNAVEITADAALSQFSFNETSSSLTQTQSGQDASLKVNGLEVSRESNDIDDVVQGLEFTLNKASVGETVNFTISEDKSTGEQAIRDFVEAYNLLYDTMKNLTGLTSAGEDDEDQTLGALSSDGSAKSMVSQLRQVLTASVAGTSDSDFSALTNLGIRTQIDGKLEIIEDDFEAAIEDNFDKIGELFAPNYAASNSAISVTPGSYVNKAISGTYDVEITTEPAKGYIYGGTFDEGIQFPLNTGSGDSYSFTISVNGTESNSITLPNDTDYTSADDLAAELQSLINGDSNLKGANIALDVAFNSTDGQFEFTSREYGSSSKVSFTAASANMANIGISDALSGVDGIDVVGTIDGKSGFGAGNVLLPEVDSDPYGLNLTVGAGSLGSSTITFGRGLAGELSLLIDNLLSGDGGISSREESLNDQIEGIEEDKEALDARMLKVEARLQSQFQAMEAILNSLQTTGSSLDGIIDRLPFTAQRS
ncbi:flagellar filament capping protein FliD [Pontibacterium granulatum]|uniref:flagellar filament capping protein FliD n=1 Tax=Pontibacterium granulatum TaxID=2036029 RepID=UPI00249A81FC|nr:flagellar filament capping protein FliD [Pontibacterium granulatum]MDI3322907.1 flagellar filament capping protein FliD [Pontibacterium granulatum]